MIPCYGDGNTRNRADLREQENMCDKNADKHDDLTGKDGCLAGGPFV